MKRPKVDNTGVAQANQAIADAQAAANNLKQNFAADLRSENIASIKAGGGAEAASSGAPVSTYRRRRTPGLATQLGINT